MKRLLPAARWIKETFPEGGVGVATVAQWILCQVIPGIIIAGKPFVDADRAALLIENNIELKPTDNSEQPTPATYAGNANVARIVQLGMTQ